MKLQTAPTTIELITAKGMLFSRVNFREGG